VPIAGQLAMPKNNASLLNLGNLARRISRHSGGCADTVILFSAVVLSRIHTTTPDAVPRDGAQQAASYWPQQDARLTSQWEIAHRARGHICIYAASNR